MRRKRKPTREEARLVQEIDRLRDAASDMLNACIDIRRPPRMDLFYLAAVGQLRAAQHQLDRMRCERA